jgi:hypothetical protein
METWTPLFSNIVRSTVWGEAPHVKIVWITILALKDRRGFVEGSVPGLARMAVVSIGECKQALEKLEGPDEESKNQEHEGRRIKSVEGGWMVLGHERYQKLMREVSTKIGNAKRQRAYRARLVVDGREGRYVKAVEDGDEGRAERIVSPEYGKE